MALACPTQLISIIEGVYYFDALICPSQQQTTASDTRDHTIGIDCSNIIDPLTVPDPIPIPTEKCAEFRCACVRTGLNRYTTLKSAVILAPGFEIDAEYFVRYLDRNDEGQELARLARLFVIKGNGVFKKKPIHIGQEIAPGSPVSDALEGALTHPLGHHQCVQTARGFFHVTTKSYLQPVTTRLDAAHEGARAKGAHKPRRAKGRR